MAEGETACISMFITLLNTLSCLFGSLVFFKLAQTRYKSDPKDRHVFTDLFASALFAAGFIINVIG